MINARLFRGCLALACLSLPMAPAAAETFYMADGDVIEGTVVRSLGSMLSIKLPGTGIERIQLDEVERVELTTLEGEIIDARITGWSKGVYQLSTDKGPLEATVENGRVVALDGEAADDVESRNDVETAGTPSIEPETAPEPEAPASAAISPSDAIHAGFVYVGPPDDGGRTFMHEKGRQTLARNPEVEETAFLELDSEDGDQIVGAIDQLVADGANVVFMTGHDSAAAVVSSAKRHQDVQFVHCGSFDPTANIQVFCGRIYQARYLSGMIAGGMTETGLIGYLAAMPTAETIVGINAFTLGVQSVEPKAEVMVHWTKSWYAPGAEQQRAEELLDRGVDVLTIHQDSPAALQVAERRGIHAIGYQSDMSAYAPSSILTSAVWNWGEMYDLIVGQLVDGDPQLRPAWLGLREGVVGLAPLSARVPDDLKRLVEQRQRELVDGRFNVFTGPIKDIDGDVRVLDGRVMTDENLQAMDYLVEGVVGY